MADRPIIFSAPMVQALLAGRKTQTRRVLKPQPEHGWHSPKVSNFGIVTWTTTHGSVVDRMAPYAPGDRLWVREAWRTWDALDGAPPVSMSLLETVHYEADGEVRWLPVKPAYQPGRLRPSIHMPRWASRLTLHVSKVRVQRLQEISEADAVAEGIAPLFTDAEKEAYPECRGDSWRNYLWHGRHDARPSWIDAWEHQYSSYEDARGSFSSLWASIHGPDAWASNPWVCAITFTVERANIDEARHA